MLSISVALLAVLPVLHAQSTVSLFFPGLGDNSYVGSIAGSVGRRSSLVSPLLLLMLRC